MPGIELLFFSEVDTGSFRPGTLDQSQGIAK
jgi:hypothetical protein